MEKHNKLKHIGENEYAFFVSESLKLFNEKTGIKTTYESWLNGTADNRICSVISVEKVGLQRFFETWKTVYLYCECVYSPVSDLDVIEINDKLNAKVKESLTKEQIEIVELKKQIESQNKKFTEFVEKQKPATKKTYTSKQNRK